MRVRLISAARRSGQRRVARESQLTTFRASIVPAKASRMRVVHPPCSSRFCRDLVFVEISWSSEVTKSDRTHSAAPITAGECEQPAR